MTRRESHITQGWKLYSGWKNSVVFGWKNAIADGWRCLKSGIDTIVAPKEQAIA